MIVKVLIVEARKRATADYYVVLWHGQLHVGKCKVVVLNIRDMLVLRA